jgi:hypothetical protein
MALGTEADKSLRMFSPRRKMVSLMQVRCLIAVLAISALFPTALLLSQPKQSILPKPDGPYDVGRINYHWIDNSRPEPLWGVPGAKRELMVHVWYPAIRTIDSTLARYFPLVQAVTDWDAGADRYFRRIFAGSYDAIIGRGATISTVENAKIASSPQPYPLLVFSPGLGAPTFLYTSQLEELASLGYVVAAIDHTYDTNYTIFPDGSMVFAETWPDALSDEFVNFQKARLDVWAADIRFVIDQLTKAAGSDSPSPFSNKIALQQIGAFGHSMGGLAAAHACQTDARIRACLNQDGMTAAMPFFKDANGQTMTQPFMLLQHRFNHDPKDAQLFKTQDEMLSSITGGSYRITIDMPGIFHGSFMDVPLLNAAAEPLEAEQTIEALKVITACTNAFFEKTLKGNKQTSLESGTNSNLKIEIMHPFGTNVVNGGRPIVRGEWSPGV